MKGDGSSGVSESEVEQASYSDKLTGERPDFLKALPNSDTKLPLEAKKRPSFRCDKGLTLETSA